MHKARLWHHFEDTKVKCHLCSFHCKIADGKRGVCGVRENQGGVLYSLNYGKLIARATDPIEKKPFFHFMPGTRSYSIATAGCNFRCLHCQNADISQMPREKHIIIGDDVTPEEVVAEALDSNCRTIAYTYTEPTIFFEYAEDTGVLAHEKGLKNIFVTNGYMTKECVGALDGIVDAANVDLKSFNDATYRRLCGARLEPVLETIERMRSVNMWIEVTTLVIPTVNDSDEELRSIARWLSELDVSIPWHISAFYPTYKMSDIARTPEEVIKRAREIGLAEGLRYVYTGNIPDLPGESTYCYECKRMLIERDGYVIKANHIEASKCPDCGALIDGVGL